MTTAFTVDSLPLKWPFAGSTAPVPPAQAQPPRSRRSGPFVAENDTPSEARPVPPTTTDGLPHAGAYGSPMTRFGVSRRQMVGDVVLVAVWAAVIPAVLWFGHAAGF